MADRGTKRRCTECSAAFYDLGHKPIVCPKCGAVHEPQVLLKSDGRQPRKSRNLPPPPPAPVVEAEPAAESDEEALPDDAVDDDEDDAEIEPDADEAEIEPPEGESDRER
jgi:uncharacterized protein (TIGR02300 family)